MTDHPPRALEEAIPRSPFLPLERGKTGIEDHMSWVDAVEVARATPPTEKELRQILEYRRRKAKPRFYADESFPAEAVRVLRSAKIEVRTSRDVGLDGNPDENHVAFALRQGFILLTCDRDYLDERRFPLIHCPAIVVFDVGRGTSLEIQHAFRCLKTMLGSPQFFDKWVKIDARRDCWSEYCRFLDGTTARARYRVHRGRLQEWVED